MMKKKSFILIFTILLIACGSNTNKSDDVKSNQDSFVQENNDCKLKFKSEDLCISLTWLKGPLVGEPSSFEIKFWKDEKTKTLSSPTNRIIVEPFMPSMGHGTSKPGKIKKIKKGLYRVTKIGLTMKGTWDIRLKLIDNAGKIIEQIVVSVSL